MKLNNIKSFKIGSEIKGFFLCHKKYLKTTRFGDPFIDVILKDTTGSVRGKFCSQVEYYMFIKKLIPYNTLIPK